MARLGAAVRREKLSDILKLDYEYDNEHEKNQYGGSDGMITRKEFLKRSGLAGLATVLGTHVAHAEDSAVEQPNILWLSTEDMGPHLGCYGDPHARTPNIDALAARGIRYTNVFTTAPVCAPNRSSIITGVHATTLGSHHMRSGGEGRRRSIKPALSPEVKCFPEYLREAGYYCSNNVKEDYNFTTTATVWDESSKIAHWRNRPDTKQPFFAVFNYQLTHEGNVREAPPREALRPEQQQDPSGITPPPYHPDTPIVRRGWANYYERIAMLDDWVAERLRELEDAGLAENTIVFFWSDHGAGLPRCKRWLYDSGLHVPLIVFVPEKWGGHVQWAPGSVVDELVSSVDFAPQVLQFAGAARPDYLQGRAFLVSQSALSPQRKYVFAGRDRMDERYDMVRMVRGKRFKYIRNFDSDKPYAQYMNTAEKSPIMAEIHRLAKENALPPGAEWGAVTRKPVEELYDTVEDPQEINNLAAKPEFRDTLERLRHELERWMRDSRDLGLIPEPELVRLEKLFGNRYAIWESLQKTDPDLFDRMLGIASRAGAATAEDASLLIQFLADSQSSIRYWAVRGLDNLPEWHAAEEEAAKKALSDNSPVVRIAAARALCRRGILESESLELLVHDLEGPEEWVRLQAALALDELGEKARPCVDALRAALKDTENKYVVRVANHALNALLESENEVP